MSDNRNNGGNPQDEFSLDSILAQYGTKKRPRASEPEAEPQTEPQTEPEPKAEPEQQPEPEPKAEPEPKPAPKAEPEVEIDEPDGDMTMRVLTFPSAKAGSAPIESAEQLRVGANLPPEEGVIDTAAFDSVYDKKQRKIRQLTERIHSDEKETRRKAEKLERVRQANKLKPVSPVTAPIKLPAAAAAELERERRAKPEGERFKAVPSAERAAKRAEDKAKKEKPNINPVTLMKKLDSRRKSAKARLIPVAFLAALLIYMTVAEPWGLPLPAALKFSVAPKTHIIVSLSALGLAVALGYDVVFGGLLNLILFRADADSLTSCSAIACAAYCVSALLDPAYTQGKFAPLAVLPILAIACSLAGLRRRSAAQFQAARRSYRLRRANALGELPEKYDGDPIYASANATSFQGFYRSLVEPDAARPVLAWLVPVIAAASLFLAVYCSFSGTGGSPLFWAWSVTAGLTPALGFFAAVSLPMSKISKRLFRSGVITGGSAAVSRISRRSFVLLRDDDIFPPEAITVNGYKLFDPDEKEFAISVAASVLDAAHTALARPFVSLAKENFVSLRPVTDLVFSDAGGISGIVDGHSVMVGNASYAARSHVTVPPDVKLRTAVFCIVDNELKAIFAVKYQVSPRCDYSLNLLEDSGYFPIVASRDFNVSASFIQSRFDVSSSDIIYPVASAREQLSDPALELPSGGILLSRDNEGMAEALVSCHRFKTVMRLGIIFSLVSSLAGLLIGALIAYNGWFEIASPINMLLYYILWAVPIYLFASYTTKF